MPNIEALRYLIEVARTNSINTAAANLYVSKSTISMAIKKLEQELNTTLLTRTHRGVLLTEDGQEVFALAQQVITLLNQISSISAKKPLLPKYTNIYATEDLLTTSMPDLLKVFSAIFGIQNFILYNSSSNENIIGQIAEQPQSIGFIQCIQLPQATLNTYSQVQYRHLGHSYMHLTASKNSQYLATNQAKVYSLKDVFQMPLIARHNDQFIYEMAAQHRLPAPMIAFSAPNNETYWQAIADDIGVGFCAQDVNKFHFMPRSDLAAFPLQEKIPLSIHLVYHKDYPSKVIAHLIQALS